MALEVVKWGIRVNAVAPGPVDTGMLTRFTHTAKKGGTGEAGAHGSTRHLGGTSGRDRLHRVRCSFIQSPAIASMWTAVTASIDRAFRTRWSAHRRCWKRFWCPITACGNLRSVGLQLIRNLHFLRWAMTERGSGAVAINQALEFSEQSIKGVGQGMTHDRQHHAAGPLACPAKKISGHECKKE